MEATMVTGEMYAIIGYICGGVGCGAIMSLFPAYWLAKQEKPLWAILCTQLLTVILIGAPLTIWGTRYYWWTSIFS
jgi:hypothetical protein